MKNLSVEKFIQVGYRNVTKSQGRVQAVFAILAFVTSGLVSHASRVFEQTDGIGLPHSFN
ncbi:MAG: hypothetical protein R3B95_21485 [Nitrospirales bacterium]|nr:hypothetical protein [Nitrospirales bacterium]